MSVRFRLIDNVEIFILCVLRNGIILHNSDVLFV